MGLPHLHPDQTDDGLFYEALGAPGPETSSSPAITFHTVMLAVIALLVVANSVVFVVRHV